MIELSGIHGADRSMQHSSQSVSSGHILKRASSVDRSVDVSSSHGQISALVVERTLPDALAIVSMLAGCEFHVTVAETFTKAKLRLSAEPPGVLITEVRLGEYNGLHLVLRGKSVRPDMAAIVLSTVADSMLQTDAEAMGATFILKPVDQKDLGAAVIRTLCNPVNPDGSRTPIRPPFERRTADRRASALPLEPDRRRGERRRDIPSLLRLVGGDD